MAERIGRECFDERLLQFLSSAKGDKLDIAAAVYDMICEEENPPQAFQYFLEKADDIQSTEECIIESEFTNSEIRRLESECTTLIKGIIKNLLGKKYEPEVFYCALWENAIYHNTMLEKEEEKKFALYIIWIDGRIPYYKIEDGLQMSNDAFKDIVNSKKEEIKKAIFILNNTFTQKTERSSLLIKILDSCNSKEEKAVILAQILSVNERKTITDFMKRIEVKDPEE